MTKKKGSSSFRIMIWLPLVVGIVVTPIAIRSASVLALSGTDALAMLYPWVQVFKSQALRIPGEIALPAAQWAMYLQFPVYGLVMGWLMRRAYGFGAALLTVVLIHAIGIAALYGLGFLQGFHVGF
jgi:hypothetical protein